MSGAVRLVLGDQLSRNLASLRGLDRTQDVVLLAEVMAEATYVPHHPQKIAFLFSAMRHFAEELRADGVRVDYIRLDDPDNTGTLGGELSRAIARHGAARAIVTFPGEWRVWKPMRQWQQDFAVPVEVKEDDRFFCPIARFRSWADGRKQLRMEFFYREMRRDYKILLTPEGQPEGGQWNFDAENRKSLPKGLKIPPPYREEPDAITAEVLALVAERFKGHFGKLEGFFYAVTAAGAEKALNHFISHCLPLFGDYQDAMAMGQETLFHSILSPYINAGLLDPRRVVDAAERAWRQGHAPLNAVEGFIRQILGWREYVRGIYWLKMPAYADTNALNAHRPLPDFYWTGRTDMNCMAQVIGQTERLAYAHHIQRLMVTGNFALLLGVEPAQIEEWYLAVYADAYDWVELPNVHGMVMHADGGYLGSKPYAASGKYIQRMSDYCTKCRYDVKETTGTTACPFNALYWNFLMENEGKLRGNPRMGLVYKGLDGMEPAKREAIRAQAGRFIAGLVPAYPATGTERS
ncbi:cryptochrome/photolyase family protein [Niveispirillum cyanobacteriorum]|uniref:Cryptochrome/photolyase family protein n=1 Tax=Niveispirillum cyanobacteriorum TaxID=1612173 RepID=A0A2K9NAZ9_9PROT|nr:cryptochrome/photolyase family protein [Niveispirillum cyanobacteriorum]AUN30182.1 cryptochrome/photolyase family protein [Niveispirillum cyanobacteriorum]GGE57144.1 deoxyribodipyrimidine photo-lyase [Niveispirillum cyanobacteriorum]